MNDGDKQRRTESLLSDWRTDIVCLLATRMGIISRETVRSLWGTSFDRSLSTLGAVIGTLVLWDKRVVDKLKESVGDHTVTCKYNYVSDGFCVVFFWCLWSHCRWGKT